MYPTGAYPIVPPLPEFEEEKGTSTATTATGGTEKKKLAPEQEAALQQSADVTNEQIAGTDEVRKHKEAESLVNAEMASETAKEAALHQQRTDAGLAETQRNADAARAKYESVQSKLDATPSPKFFRDGDTWGNALRGLRLALGGIGDAMQQSAMIRIGKAPTAMNTPMEIIQADLAQQREHIARMRDDVAIAKTGIQDAAAAKKDLLSDIDLKAATAFKRLEALGKARLAAIGMDAPAIEQHQAILALKSARAQSQQNFVAPMFDTVKAGWDKHTGTTEKETYRKPQAQTRGPGAEDVTNVNQLQTDIAKLDRTIGLIEQNPKSAEKWRQNEESWRRKAPLRETTVGKIATGVGVMNVAPEQGLQDDPTAKQIHQGMAQVGTSIAKGYGGVITDSDRQSAASEMATLANDPKEQAASLKRARDLLKTKLDNFQRNRGVQLEPGAPGTAPGPPTQPTAFQPQTYRQDSELSPRDQIAVRNARARLKANPNDAIAIQVLQQNQVAP